MQVLQEATVILLILVVPLILAVSLVLMVLLILASDITGASGSYVACHLASWYGSYMYVKGTILKSLTKLLLII